jgi:hypothetical protein
MIIRAGRSVPNASRVAAISVTAPVTGLMELIINIDQDDMIIAVAIVIASVVTALTLG